MDVIAKAVFGLNLNRHLKGLSKIGLIGRSSPVVFIAGFQKSGTTSLYKKLISSGYYKQPYMKEDNRLALNPANILEFQYGFPYSIKNSKSICASHLFTFIPGAIDSIKNFYPGAKVLLIVRNPIDRAISHFDMDKRFGWLPEALTAENWMKFELETILKGNVDFRSIESVHKTFNLFNWRFGSPLVRGIYYPYVNEFIKREMPVHVVELSELKLEHELNMNKIYDFLEMPIDKRLDSKEFNLENKAPEKSTISEELKLRLSEFYKEPNDLLFDLLDKRYTW